MIDLLALCIPLAYLGVLVGTLATFSSLYRKRKAHKAASLEPWFPPHLQRDVYLSLLHMEPPASKDPSEKKKAPAVPSTVLKAALLRRAREDIKRLFTMRSQKPALGILLQKGSVSDDFWQRFLVAEKEMEAEIGDVISEANALSPNWGQLIFASANEMFINANLRELINQHQDTVAQEKESWDKKRESMKKDLMEEMKIEEDMKKSAVEKPKDGKTTTTIEDRKQSSASIGGGDGDSVISESAKSSASSAANGKNTSSKKKKKGKK